MPIPVKVIQIGARYLRFICGQKVLAFGTNRRNTLIIQFTDAVEIDITGNKISVD
jgi:hypothetical protein